MLLLPPKDSHIKSCNAQLHLMIDYSNGLFVSSSLILQGFFGFFLGGRGCLIHVAKYSAKHNHQGWSGHLPQLSNQRWLPGAHLGGYSVEKLRSGPFWFLHRISRWLDLLRFLTYRVNLSFAWWGLSQNFCTEHRKELTSCLEIEKANFQIGEKR